MEEYNINLDEEFKKLKNILDKVDTIAIVGHEMPDGDSIGSMEALRCFFNYLKKDVYTFAKEIPEKVQKTVNTKNILENVNIDKLDLCIFVDHPNITRINKEFIILKEMAEKTVVIDHHKDNELIGDINIVKIMTSTTELVYLFIRHYLGDKYEEFKNDQDTRKTYIDIMKYISLGLITDSGGFRHQNMNSLAFLIAAEAMSENIDIYNIYRINIIEKSKNEFMLDKLIRERIEYIDSPNIAYAYLTYEDIEYKRCGSGETESIGNIGKELEGNKVSIILKEDIEGIRVSVRTNLPYSSFNIVKVLNGGGHFGAAGAYVKNNDIKNMSFTEKKLFIDEIKDTLIKEARKEIKRCDLLNENK